jgi:hypothetical protein
MDAEQIVAGSAGIDRVPCEECDGRGRGFDEACTETEDLPSIRSDIESQVRSIQTWFLLSSQDPDFKTPFIHPSAED